MSAPEIPAVTTQLVPVLALRDVCLFPEASLSLAIARPAALRAVDIARRMGGRVFALAQKDPKAEASRELHEVGTLAAVVDESPAPTGGLSLELDGLRRARVLTLVGSDTLVAEVELIEEGDPGDEWGPAVEALARYMHAHADLRAFLDSQRRSREPMAWVNLACQHLPIAASARQKLLDSDAPTRCLKISRGLDALLRKQQAG
jgi:Lon protease-like protein